MLSYRHSVAMMAIGLLLAGTLYADHITYVVGTGDKAAVKAEDDITVTGWGASKVDYKTSDGKSSSVKYSAIISVDRHGGTMSPQLSEAIDMIASDVGAATPQK